MGQFYDFDDIEPWPDPVDGARLLDALVNTLDRHMALPAGAADAVALWVLHAPAHDMAPIYDLVAEGYCLDRQIAGGLGEPARSPDTSPNRTR